MVLKLMKVGRGFIVFKVDSSFDSKSVSPEGMKWEHSGFLRRTSLWPVGSPVGGSHYRCKRGPQVSGTSPLLWVRPPFDVTRTVRIPPRSPAIPGSQVVNEDLSPILLSLPVFFLSPFKSS